MDSASAYTLPSQDDHRVEPEPAETSPIGHAQSASGAASGSASPAIIRIPPRLTEPGKKRSALSCVNCRRRKIRCDQTFPCGPCIIRNDQHSCKQVSPADTGPAFTPLSDHHSLQDKVDRLEAKLASLERQSSRPTSSQPSPLSSNGCSPASAATGVTQEDKEPEVAFVLESFAMGSKRQHQNLTHSLDATTNSPPTLPSQHRAPAFEFLFPSGEFDLVERAIGILPAGWRTQVLVDNFFNRAHWQHRTFNRLTYLRQAQPMIDNGPATPKSAVESDLLCLHLAVLCVSYHFLPADVAASLGLSPDQVRQLAHQTFCACQGMLLMSDFFNNHSLWHLQAVVVTSMYQYAVGEQADSHWTLTGSALKCAQNLGLPNLVEEGRRGAGDWPRMWNTLEKREMGRRVWWNLVSLDWTHALGHGGHCRWPRPAVHSSDLSADVLSPLLGAVCIDPARNQCAVPLNIGDDHLGPGCVAESIDKYTDVSLQIFKIEFLQLEGELLAENAAGLTEEAAFEQVLRMDLRLLEVQERLPPYFRDPASLPSATSPTLLRDSIIINIVAENRLVRLHRPWLVRGFREAKYAPFSERCLSSALALLRLLRLAGTACPDLFNAWVVLFFGFSAAVVAFLGLQKEENTDTRTLLLDVLCLFRTGEANNVARKAADMLEALLKMEPELKTPRTSSKRLRGEDEDPREADAQDKALASVVKRIVTGRPNAQRAGATPGASAALAAALTSTSPFPANAFSPAFGLNFMPSSGMGSGASPFSFESALGLSQGAGMDEAYDPTERFPMPLASFGGDLQFLSELGGRRDGPSGQEDFLVQFGLGSM